MIYMINQERQPTRLNDIFSITEDIGVFASDFDQDNEQTNSTHKLSHFFKALICRDQPFITIDQIKGIKLIKRAKNQDNQSNQA